MKTFLQKLKHFFQKLIQSIKQKPLKAACSALMVIFAGVFIYCAVFLIIYFNDSHEQAQQNNELIDIVEQMKQEVLKENGGVSIVNPDGSVNEEMVENPLLNGSNVYVDVTSDNGDIVTVLKEYATIYKMNNDMVGWIQIPGTKVNYPVLQNMDVTNYYLKRDFYKQDARHGSIYAYEWADFNAPSQNITLFGHNMGDGSMFAGLHAYEKEAFFKDHPYILFDTLDSHQIYKVVAVFYTTTDPTTGFDYHEFTDGDEHEFGMFVQQCKALSMYDTGVTPFYGSELLTLSTCDDDVTDDTVRFVVVAMKVSL